MNALFPFHATTRDIIVHVAVTFLPEQSEPDRGRWFWAYHIRIENQGDQPVQLLTRHWIITDGRGAQHMVDGDGVVGEQPVVQPGKSYDYVSVCPLNTPTGSMKGSYRMIGVGGETFDVAIPHFALIAPAVAE
ncbi:Co2+/Mg2+ efflux protein ApaG [Sphingomonas bisphenolicum]|uniref:Protein ApaG n=1 Tax=Sphingomonas bisphenolicum TaxID=296544 RepID=A0ABN5WLN8_9SPHN|nr:Co2+/Mg2+ efflux protein ApaG [Sphingomonas bisphenolicum]BBF70471.1 protein ApaG [Sphingomonas bisphenolicum]